MQKSLVLFPLSLAFNEKEEIRNEDTRNAFNVHCEYNEIIPYLSQYEFFRRNIHRQKLSLGFLVKQRITIIIR